MKGIVKGIVTIVTKIETEIVDAIVTEIGIETGTGTETGIGTGIEIGTREETVTEIVIGRGVQERIEIVKDESGVVAGGCGTCSNVVMSLRTFVLCTKNCCNCAGLKDKFVMQINCNADLMQILFIVFGRENCILDVNLMSFCICSNTFSLY